ncbi:Gfo/Idh/MocA family oxidoreductase [Chelativorans sp. ZYF759]|uniref:Gfo/Idh/MocA family protein n=1 Tax=Chelativorans sp. ZYF759 TaxID=2692213 RepID=UPI00145F47E5|nr:Gfo/Idh/MocA family oxidoreductase [Chelativorans sp. ZYF759]NMG41825.1 Gfo/Idh/MocA family oxidoreductase [Chelativorans sp. ZYF759]
MSKVRVAAFGTGFFSHYHYDAWNRIESVELVGLCVNSNRERAQEFATQYSVPEIFTDPVEMLDRTRPDLVDIITTPESHTALVELAAARNIPMICQKPLAPSLEEAHAMVEAAEVAGALLIAHENWRFKPWNREMAKLLRAGAIGEPYNISFRMRPGDGQGPHAYLDRQPYFQKMPRFLVHETGVHMIDVFRFLMGEMSGVFARLQRLNPAIKGEDAGILTFGFVNGAAGVLDGNRLADFEAENPRLTMGILLVEGSEGSIRLDGAGRLFLRSKGGAEREHVFSWTDRGYAGDCVHALQAHVIAHLRDGTPVENTGREYLRNVEIVEAVYQSNEEGRWIAL